MNSGVITYVAMQAVMLLFIIGSGTYFICKRKRNRSVRVFAVMCAGACLWGGGQFCLTCLSLWFPNETVYFWVNTLTYAGICIITPASVVFTWTYRGLYKYYEKSTLLRAVCAPAVLLFALHITNPLHHWYYSVLSAEERVYSVLAYTCAAWSYMCVLYACVTLAVYHKRQHPEYIKYFVVCAGFPLAANTMNMLMRNDLYDLTVPGLFLLMAGAGILIFRHRLVNITPLASRKILMELGYPVLILSPEGDKLFENNAAKDIPGIIDLYAERTASAVRSGNGKVYRPSLTVLPDGNKMLAFTDTTRYEEMLAQLRSTASDLKKLQAELSEQMKATEEYAAIAEEDAAQRSRMEITSALNNRVYVVINRILENTEQGLSAAIPRTEAIQNNIALTKEGIRTVRAIINEYKGTVRHGL